MTSVTGEVHTQAAWADQASAISGQLAGITGSTENMLASLSAVNAGREHIRAAAEWADQVRTVLAYGTSLVTGVNRRQDPYVGTVQAAGGSAEVASPAYYREM
jgi:hypothetical protein